MTDHPPHDTNQPEATKPESQDKQKPKRKRSKLAMFGLVLLIFLACSALIGGGAEYYTARPVFCGSCHIMDPYYDSWTQDKHGAKFDVWCVECHYAPGEQHTLMAKFKGLSQLASYFSGRAGASRPRAHVADASCLRSGCHGDGEFRNELLMIGERRTETRFVAGFETEVERKPTVGFVHQKHLDITGKLREVDGAINDLTERIKTKLPADSFEQVRAASRSVAPAEQREPAMRDLLERLELRELEDDATRLLELEHERLRLVQLEGITCAACHTYDAEGANHFTVDQQTCFVCHFTNQKFNHDTGECLRCHEPPTRKIAVHGMTLASDQPGSGSLMDHRDLIDRGINCASCHIDVVRGSSTVTERDCTSCHDQRRFLEDFAARNTRIVEEYHRVHIAGQRARCQDCHRNIEHNLIDPTHIGTSAGFLEPVLKDCQHCHPNHHHEQVQLLMGTGGRGVTTPMPNAMFGSRINCSACHTESGTDEKAATVIEATKATCIACHGEDYGELFVQWSNEIAAAVAELETTLERAVEQIQQMQAQGATISADLVEITQRARANLHFVKSGNGMHNKNYALRLLEFSQRETDAALVTLSSQ